MKQLALFILTQSSQTHHNLQAELGEKNCSSTFDHKVGQGRRAALFATSLHGWKMKDKQIQPGSF